MKIKKSSIIIFILLIISASLLLYPTVSNLWNSMHQTSITKKLDAKTKVEFKKKNKK